MPDVGGAVGAPERSGDASRQCDLVRSGGVRRIHWIALERIEKGELVDVWTVHSRVDRPHHHLGGHVGLQKLLQSFGRRRVFAQPARVVVWCENDGHAVVDSPTTSFAPVVISATERIHSPVSGSDQFSQRPATPKGC